MARTADAGLPGLNDRQSAIVRIVRDHGFASIGSLADEFEVSRQTIRRDIIELARRNPVQHHHGGAGLPTGRDHPAHADRRGRGTEAKRRIARTVAREIPNGASPFIDIGTTTEAVAEALLEHKGLRIITDRFGVIRLFRRNTEFEIVLAGGMVRNRDVAFALVLVQLMIMPEVLIVENYRTMSRLGLVDTIAGIGLPYMASAFGIFLLRQTFKTIPRELEEAARVEGCSMLQILWKVYVPLARPTYVAYGLVSVSYHWNNFLWPLVITNSVETRPLTVGLAIFGAPESGVDWSVITAGTLLAVAPLLLAFLLFQRQFVQSFMYAGIK